MDPITVFFYGPAGCGKGTQVALLKTYLEAHDVARNTLQIETGAAFRNFIGANDSYTGKLTKGVVDKGELPDVFISVWLWVEALVKTFTGSEHLLFDGFPRRVLEAQVLDGALSLYGRERIILFVLNVSSEKVIERLRMRQRADDLSEDQVKKRLAWYQEEVLPTIEYYRHKDSRYRVLDIDGERSIEEVHADIINALGFTSSKI